MRLRLMTIAGGLLLAASTGSACAMTTPTCTLAGADKLPADIPRDFVCEAIRSAVGESGHGVSIAVRIVSAHGAAASVTLPNGRTLPDVNVSASDSKLNRRSIDMLARGIARQLASAL